MERLNTNRNGFLDQLGGRAKLKSTLKFSTKPKGPRGALLGDPQGRQKGRMSVRPTAPIP